MSEADELYEMVNLVPRLTGLPMTVWAQPRGRAARLVLEVGLYVLLYRSGKFFNRERCHINRNVRRANFGCRRTTQGLRLWHRHLADSTSPGRQCQDCLR